MLAQKSKQDEIAICGTWMAPWRDRQWTILAELSAFKYNPRARAFNQMSLRMEEIDLRVVIKFIYLKNLWPSI